MADRLAQITEGAKLHAVYSADGEYYPAVVVSVSTAQRRKAKPVKISYVGYDEEVWVSLDSLKSKKLGLKGAPTLRPKVCSKAQSKKDPTAEDFSYLLDQMKAQAFAQLPEKIIFLRHGESEANVRGGSDILATKPDHLIELTEKGQEQAKEAGRRIAKLLGPEGSISVVLSPFERTQQTLCCVTQALGEERVRTVHLDTRVREQEFGNLQDAEQIAKDREGQSVVGRFFYRRPNGESSADVYDRASDFWESFCSGYSIRTRFSPAKSQAIRQDDKALLVVTHGLTMRLLFMRFFSWSVDTFDTVFNPGNCDMWVLTKNHKERRYDLAPRDCHPQRVPWAVRQIHAYPKGSYLEQGSDGEPYTVLDYLSVPAPRTSHKREALSRVVKGHPGNLDSSRNPDVVDEVLKTAFALDPDEWEIDWWCGKKSCGAVTMRTNLAAGGFGVGPGVPITGSE